MHDLSNYEYFNKVVYGFNKTDVDLNNFRCLHILFEEQVSKTPNNIAVMFGEKQFTYAEINQLSNSLSCLILASLPQKNTPIGIMLERSEYTIISMLAVLKSGLPYVPIDVNFPDDRINFIIDDAQIRIVLTTSTTTNIAKSGLSLIDVEQINKQDLVELSEKYEMLKPTFSINDLAYILYTSGTTGMPKGVKISHFAICNHMKWIILTFKFSDKDIILQKTPYIFDASVWEFYAPLLVGGILAIASVNAHKDTEEAISQIKSYNVTLIQGVPSFLNTLSEHRFFKECSSLRLIFSGGEILTKNLVKKIYNKLNINVCNLYGPTETCIDAAYCICDPLSDFENIPIGKPVSNCKIYILDDDLNPVPLEDVGEIYIGGHQLAEGYLNNVNLTNEKFIEESKYGLGRLYKTGDLGYWDRLGNLYYKGRIDNQIKFKGYRIELEEIEQSILKYYKVNQSVVVLSEDGLNLFAYVTFGNFNADIDELKSYLTKILPNYMIPSKFIVLDNFEKNFSGKIDRKQLSQKVNTISKIQNPSHAKNELEKELCSIWSDCLEIEDIGISDNFLDLGGDSLVAMMIQAECSNKGIKVKAQQIYEYQTIEELAKVTELIKI